MHYRCRALVRCVIAPRHRPPGPYQSGAAMVSEKARARRSRRELGGVPARSVRQDALLNFEAMAVR